MAAECVVEWFGDLRARGTDVAWAVALACACKEGELANDDNLATGICDVAVHDALAVVEDAQGDNLAAEPVDVVLAVGVLDAQEHQHAGFYAAFRASVDADAGFLYALYDDSHIAKLRIFFITHKRIVQNFSFLNTYNFT